MIALAREADRTWMTDAACRGHDADLWYPTAGLPSAYALAICNACPVQQRCAEYAEVHRERHGVWGGMNAEQRNRRVRRRGMEIQ